VLSQVLNAHLVAVAVLLAVQPVAHVMVLHAAFSLQHKALSDPVLSQVLNAHLVAVAVLSAVQPVAHVMVLHASHRRSNLLVVQLNFGRTDARIAATVGRTINHVWIEIIARQSTIKLRKTRVANRTSGW